jgi:hypothetical protein
VVECQLPKLDVAGSSPVSRSIFSTYEIQPQIRSPFDLRLVHAQTFSELVHHVGPTSRSEGVVPGLRQNSRVRGPTEDHPVSIGLVIGRRLASGKRFWGLYPKRALPGTNLDGSTENGVLNGNGQTGSYRAIRDGDGSRHSRCRFRVLQRPILGTADSEYWHCLGVRSFLLQIPQAHMN